LVGDTQRSELKSVGMMFFPVSVREVPDSTFAGFWITDFAYRIWITDFVLVFTVKCTVMQRALINMLMSLTLVCDI